MRPRSKFLFLALLALLLVFAMGGVAQAATPTVSSDYGDYAPGAWVVLTGTGWGADAAVNVVVDDSVGSWAHSASVPVIGETFTYTFQLPYQFVATYNVTATGSPSGMVATTSFKDTATDFHQARNNFTDPGIVPGDIYWWHSEVSGNDSIYFESMSVPYRLAFRDLAGTTDGHHEIHFSLEFHDGTFAYGHGNYVFDVLTGSNPPDNPATPLVDESQPCGVLPWSQDEKDAFDHGVDVDFSPGGVARGAGPESGNVGAATYAAVLGMTAPNADHEKVICPDDPYVSNGQAVQTKIDAYETLYGNRYIDVFSDNTISNATLALAHGNFGGRDSIQYILEWDGPANTITNVAIAFGAHLAVGYDGTDFSWGTRAQPAVGCAASSGMSAHSQMDYVDTSVGATTNQINTSAIHAATLKSGIKFEDKNNNGTYEAASDALIDDWEIRAYLDKNKNGVLDVGDFVDRDLPVDGIQADEVFFKACLTGSGLLGPGQYKFELPGAGVPGPDGTTITDTGMNWIVVEISKADWEQVAPPADVVNTTGDTNGVLAGLEQGGYVVPVAWDAIDDNNNFGNKLKNADLAITKTDSRDPVWGFLSAPYNQTVYTLTITNNGPATAKNVVVTDTIDSLTTYVAGSAEITRGGTTTSVEPTKDATGKILTWTFASGSASDPVMADDEVVTIKFTVSTTDADPATASPGDPAVAGGAGNPPATLPAHADRVNRVAVDSDTPDNVAANDKYWQPTGVISGPTDYLELAVDKAVDADGDGTFSALESIPEPGATVTYQVTVTNNSPYEAVKLTDADDSLHTSIDTLGDVTWKDSNGDPIADITTYWIAVGDYVVGTFQGEIDGEAYDEFPDTITVAGVDQWDRPVSDTGDAEVDLTDVAPVIAVDKAVDADGDGTFSALESIPEPGATVTYQVTVTNNSTVDAVKLTDADDSLHTSIDTLGDVTWKDSNGDPIADITTYWIAVGDYVVGTFQGEIDGEAYDEFPDTITVKAVDNDGTPTSDTGDAEVDLTDVAPVIAVDKAVDADGDGTFSALESIPEPGATVTYQVTVTNNSTVDAVKLTDADDSLHTSIDTLGDVTWKDSNGDPIADITTYWIAVGDYVVGTFQGEIDGEAYDEFPDTITVKAVDNDGTPTSDTGDAEVDLTDVAPVIAVDKAVDADGDGTFSALESIPEPGATVTYQVTVTNNSTVDAVKLTDADDSLHTSIDTLGDVTWKDSNGDPIADITTYWIAVGDYVVGTFQGEIDGEAYDEFPDTITVKAVDNDGTPTSDTGDAEVDLTDVAPVIAVDKAVDADGDGTFSALESIPEPGATVTYQVTVTNNSTVDAVKLTDADDSLHTSIDTLGDVTWKDSNGDPIADITTYWIAVGDYVVGTFQGEIDGEAYDEFPDTITVKAVDNDGTPTSDTGDAEVDLTDVAPVIAVDKAVDADGDGTFSALESIPEPGATVTYQVTVTNNSTVDAVKLTDADDSLHTSIDTLGDVTWKDSNGDPIADITTYWIAVGDYVVGTFQGEIDGEAYDEFPDTITVKAVDNDGTPTSDTGDAEVDLTDVAPVIAVDKAVDADGDGTFSALESIPEPGATVTYQVTVTNNSTVDAVKLTDADDSLHTSIDTLGDVTWKDSNGDADRRHHHLLDRGRRLRDRHLPG